VYSENQKSCHLYHGMAHIIDDTTFDLDCTACFWGLGSQLNAYLYKKIDVVLRFREQSENYPESRILRPGIEL